MINFSEANESKHLMQIDEIIFLLNWHIPHFWEVLQLRLILAPLK